MGYKLNDMYPSKYLKAEDLEEGQEIIITITGVAPETFGEGPKADTKYVVASREAKPFVLNKTNASIITKLHGDDTDMWFGKQVILFAMDVSSFGDVTRAIRVRNYLPNVIPAASAAPQVGPAPQPSANAPQQPQAPARPAGFDTGDDVGSGPILVATRADIIAQAKIFWGDEQAAAKLKEYLSPKGLNSLSESVAQTTLADLKKKVHEAMNPQAATRTSPAALYPEDDFDDSDPFAD